jgi:hypothetical protein
VTSPTPLQRYAAVQKVVDKELAAILRDAANEGERILERLLGRTGVGAAVQRRQVAEAVRALRTLQGQMWGHITPAVSAGMARAGMQVAEAENLVNRLLFNPVFGGPIPELERAMQVRAQVAIKNYQARMDNGISLSDQVYKSKALSNGLVDKEINRGLLLGRTAKQIASSVRDLINPATPGGVSYAAFRLGRTEVNNAFHRAQINQRIDSPFTTGFKWHLSGSHPTPDECNQYAEKTHFDGGDPGVFRPGDVPGKPHPNCLCYLTTEQISEEEFIQGFISGKYNTYIDEQVYRYAPHVSPCG